MVVGALHARAGGPARLSLPALAAGLFLLFSVPAAASPVLVLNGGRIERRDDRYLSATRDERAAPAEPALWRRAAPRQGHPTERALRSLRASGAIDAATYDADLAEYRACLAATHHLSRARASDLRSVIANVDGVASSGQLVASRLKPLFLTLARNRQWMEKGPLPAAGERVEFAGSALVWERYAGQGLELQPLASFGKANGLWSAHHNTQLGGLLDELVPLAASRGGALAWEYYFRFSGGQPPWASGMAQATAVQALGRAATRLARPDLTTVAHQALTLFELPPPVGVRVATATGAHYLLYSFAPRERVLNGFLQTVIGLGDFASTSGDATAAQLAAAGDAEARVAIPRYDTGAWSLYDLTSEADRSYHELVIGFLHRLCKTIGAPVYCTYAQRFAAYEHVPPTLALLTKAVRTAAPASLRLRLDKISHVTLTVRRGGRRVLTISVLLTRGVHVLRWRRAGPPGRYALTAVATDLAGNLAAASAPLTIRRRRRR